jgi:hypothetical protein
VTFLSDVADHLAAAGIATETLVKGTNLFLNSKPDSPEIAVVLYETAQQRPTHTFGTGAPAFEFRGIQVVARAASHTVAESLARDIFDVLNLVVNETVGSTVVLRCEAQQSPFPLQRDSQHRMEFVCNYVFSVI